MAPALQVTHLLAFTLTDIAPSLRIVRLSNGPTLSFRVERYSLVKDIITSSRHAKHLSSIESMSAPLVHTSPLPPRACAYTETHIPPPPSFLLYALFVRPKSSSWRPSPHRALLLLRTSRS